MNYFLFHIHTHQSTYTYYQIVFQIWAQHSSQCLSSTFMIPECFIRLCFPNRCGLHKGEFTTLVFKLNMVSYRLRWYQPSSKECQVVVICWSYWWSSTLALTSSNISSFRKTIPKTKFTFWETLNNAWTKTCCVWLVFNLPMWLSKSWIPEHYVTQQFLPQ